MSEIQTLSGSELQSIELSDAELQSIEGGGWAMKMAAFYEKVVDDIALMLSNGGGKGGGSGQSSTGT